MNAWDRVVDQHIQVSIEDLERKLEKLETACGPPVNLIMLQVSRVQYSTEKTANMKLCINLAFIVIH